MILNGLNDEGAVGDNAGMNDPQPIDPRRRIRELLAIPDRDRTDAEWDELNELEIRTAPGNREVPERSQDKRFNQPSPGHQKRQDRKPERKSSNGPNTPRSEARPQQEQRQDGKPQENRNQEGRSDGRPPRRQHRRPKRTSGNNSGNGGAAGNNGAGSNDSGNAGSGEGSAPAA